MSEINPNNNFTDFRTPRSLFTTFDDRFMFDLDVAANDENALCPSYFTEETNGLKQPWNASSVWCNPPYSNPKAWISKALAELEAGHCNVVVMLLNVDSSTTYFHDMIMPCVTELHLIRGRVDFGGPHVQEGTKNPKPSMICVFTHDIEPAQQWLNAIYPDGTQTGKQTRLTKFPQMHFIPRSY